MRRVDDTPWRLTQEWRELSTGRGIVSNMILLVRQHCVDVRTVVMLLMPFGVGCILSGVDTSNVCRVKYFRAEVIQYL